MKATLERLFRETLEDIALARVMPQHVRVTGSRLRVADEDVDLDACDRIVVAALGKAAYTMTATLQRLLAPRPIAGIAVGPGEPVTPLAGVQAIRGRHPYPDAGSLRGARALLAAVSGLQRHDLVCYLLSGGGSALAECPCHPAISLDDLSALHGALVTSGADIVEMNVVRKHFSGLKGGRLAAAAVPARQITLFVSDVPVDQPSTVASGPTMPDASTLEDVEAILQRLQLATKVPAAIRALLDARELTETPKPGSDIFTRSSWHCLLDNAAAVDAMRERAQALGWGVGVDCSVDDWPLPDAVNTLLARLHALAASQPERTVCLISGGELSCPVTGDGIGGRNQAFALHAAQRIAGTNVTVLSAGTDGIDGNSPAAGAVADGTTVSRAAALGLSATESEARSDSHSLFHALDDAIVTGPTGNNVRDLRLLVCGR